MKKTTLLFIYSLIISLLAINLKAQTSLIVTLNDGSQSGILLSQLNKMTFLSGNLNLWKTDTSITPISTASINKISFGVLSGIETIENSSNVQIFPNPVTDYFNIKTNSEIIQTACLTSLDGRIIRVLCANEILLPVDISLLPKGIYILKTEIGNFKIIKQ